MHIGGPHSFAMCYCAVMKKKLENIGDFIWRYEMLFVSLHPDARLADQAHRWPAMGVSYDRSEG